MTTTQAPRALRSYQTAAVAAVERDWESGKRRVGVVLPTGAGKSTVIAKLTSNAYHAGERIVCLAHRGELLKQMRRDLIATDPSIPLSDMGIVMADEDDSHAPIVFASLQTLAHAKRRAALGPRTKIFWDEVHHAGADGYHTTFSDLGGYDKALMCGFTATMYRNEQGTIGLGDVIQKVSYEKDLRWAIKHGFLVQPRGMTVRIKGLDALNDVRTVAGDFKNDDLAEIMEAAVEYVVDAVELHASNRTNIVFAASVEGAHMIAEAMNERGLSAEAVTGAMKSPEREAVYERYRTGVTKNLVTVMVLTEGADFPICDGVVMARPTRSKNLYAQMVGRALRLYEDPITGAKKTDALVLDLSGSTRAMRLINLTDLSPGAPVTEVDEDGAVIEICDACGLYAAECQCAVLAPDDEIGGDPLDLKVTRQGPVDMVTIDLLANSDTLWLETPKGIPFISGVNGWFVFLWPELPDRSTGKWLPGLSNTKVSMTALPLQRGETVAGFLDLEDAVDFAEAWVYEDQQRFQFSDRNASWRRNQAPSEKQLGLARSLKIVGADNMTKAALSDEISIKYVSAVVDGHFA